MNYELMTVAREFYTQHLEKEMVYGVSREDKEECEAANIWLDALSEY